jgi:hypothetical protein
MDTQDKQILRLKVTLQDDSLKSLQGLSKMFKGANTPSIIRMALINYYEQLKQTKSTSPKKNKNRRPVKTKQSDKQLAKQIVEEEQETNLPTEQIEEAMADYWTEEIQPGLQNFLQERQRQNKK